MWVEVLPSGRYRGVFRLPDGRKRGKAFDYEWEAEVWAADAEKRLGELVRPEPGPVQLPAVVAAAAAPRLDVYFRDYIERRSGLLVESTVLAYGRVLKAVAAAPFGKRPMDQVEKADIERWITAQLRSGDGRPLVNYRLTLLRSVYTAARKYEDPTAGIKKLTVDIDEAVIVDSSDQARLLAACVDDHSALKAYSDGSRIGIRAVAAAAGVSTGTVSTVLNGKAGVSERTVAKVLAAVAAVGYVHHATRGPDVELQAMVLLGLQCGLRWEETAALPASCLRNGYIKIRQVVVRGRKIRRYPKGKRERNLPATPRVITAITPLIESARARGGSDALLFASSDGLPLDYRGWLRNRYGPAVERAGLDPAPTSHDLRHTFATALADHGVPTHEIQALLGHADPEMTSRYVHKGSDGRRRDLVFAAFDVAA